MNDTVKIVLYVPRKNVLLLAKIIEAGLWIKDETLTNLLSAANKTGRRIYDIIKDALQNGWLTEMNEKLQVLETK